MSRFRHIDPPPAHGCEFYNGLKILRFDSAKARPLVKVWRGKAQKPYAHYQFGNLDQRAHWIEREKKSHDLELETKTKRKAEGAARKKEFAEKLKVGMILVNSWGYDQTNVDFFQIVERRGMVVIIREINGEAVKGSDGFMCNHVRALPDSFCGDPIRKIIGNWGLSMSFGSLAITDTESKHYQSWYA